MKQITIEWVEKAEGDYKVASSLFAIKDPVFEAICFHAQQCAEKYFKAWLIESDVDFPKTHDIEHPLKLCWQSIPNLQTVVDDIRYLASYAVEIRYPGTTATIQEANRCFEIGKRVRFEIRAKLLLQP